MMSKLRACYPGKVADPELWAMNIVRYFDELGRLPPAVLVLQETLEVLALG